MSLTPILVAGFGRSGTTALMELLGTCERIAFDRRYPFENRWLTYFAKAARLATSPNRSDDLGSDALCDFDDPRLGGIPWPNDTIAWQPPAIEPDRCALLRTMWSEWSERARRQFPAASHYAEKAPAWLPAAVQDAVPARTIHLVRDPRDVLLSVGAFNTARGSLAFGRSSSDTDCDYARRLARDLLLYFENQRAESGRADCMTLRFEDLVLDRKSAASRLSSFLGVPLSPSPIESAHRAIHQTSATLEAAVERWRREPLPADAKRGIESLTVEAMSVNGYECGTTAPTFRAIDLAEIGATSGDGTAARRDGVLTIDIAGPDFWIDLPASDHPARRTVAIWACVRGNTGDHCSVYWRRPRESFDEGRCVHVRFHPGGHWQIVCFPVAGHAHWHGTIAGLRLDLFNGPNAHGSGELRWLRLVD